VSDLTLHLGAALAGHVRRLRADGVRPPAELLALAAAFPARGGQPRTLLEPDALGADDGRMLFDAEELAAVLHVSERTARRMQATGEVPSVSVAGKRLTRAEDLRRFVEQLPTNRAKGTTDDH
jgi:hypothetical protein